ncbi:YncE family protein, partial [candidate division WOR-3 bacterium]|nr:YncE family protein [candidate division WOR-3 bacterium]
MRAILPAVCCICFLLRTAGAQWLETTIWLPDSLGGIEHPWAVYYVPPSNCVYVCGEEGVLVVDCATIARVARFDLSEPSLLAFDSRDNKVYLHYYGQGESLAVIDPVAHRVVSRVRAGRYIEALCYNPVANKLYCLGGSNTDTITVVDCEGDSVLSRVYVGECRGETGQLCCNTLGNKVYCAAYYADSVAVIDGAGDSLLTFVPLGESPRRVVYCPAGNKVYCSVHNSDQVAVIDAGPDTVLRRIQVSEGPATLGYNPVSNKAYVAPWHSDGVDIIDCSADTLLRWVGPGGEDYMVAFVLDSADNRVFCLNGYYEYIPAICGWGDTLVGQVELEGGHESPDAVCYSPVENCLYIIGEEITDLVVADAATCRVVGRVQLMCEPYLPCYTSARDKL